MASISYQTTYRGDMQLVKTWALRIWLGSLLVVALIFTAFPLNGTTVALFIASGVAAIAAVISFTKNSWSNKTGQLVQPGEIVAERAKMK